MDIYHDIVVALTGSQTAGPIVQADVGAAGLRQTVSVELNLNRLTFVISKSDPDLTVFILQPDGVPLDIAMPNVRRAGSPNEEIWVIDSPTTGDWAILISGAGQVMVWKDYQPAPTTPTPLPTATLRSTVTPSPTVTPLPDLQIGHLPEGALVGQPVTVTASLSYISADSLTIRLVADGPNEMTVTESLLDDGRIADDSADDGLYSTRLILPESGDYLITVEAWQGERLLAERQSRLIVETAPDLVITNLAQPHRLRRGETIQFHVEWQLAGQRVQPDSQLVIDGIEAGLLVPDASPVPIVLEPAGYGAYAGETTVPVDEEVILWVSGTTTTAAGVVDRQQVNQLLVIQPPLPIVRWIGTALILVAIVSGTVYRSWLRRQPVVTGSLSLVTGTGFSGDQPREWKLDSLRRRVIRIGREGDIDIAAANASFTIRVGLPLPDGNEMLITGDEAIRLNDRPLTSEQPLQDGDLIALDKTKLRYQNLRLRHSRRQAALMADWQNNPVHF
jgi:hypothetical protein